MRSTKLLALALMLFAVTVHAGRKSGSADKDRPKKKSKATAEDDSTDTTNTDPIANEGEDCKETHHCCACGYTHLRVQALIDQFALRNCPWRSLQLLARTRGIDQHDK